MILISQNTAKPFQKSDSQFRGERAETEVGVDGSIHKSVNGYHISQALLDGRLAFRILRADGTREG